MNQNPNIIAAIIAFIGALDYGLITGLASLLAPWMLTYPVAMTLLFLFTWVAVFLASILGFRYLERLF